MAAAPWVVHVRVRALGAEDRCDRARSLLRGAVPLLASPMHVADAAGAQARSQQVIAALSEAGTALTFAAVTTEAAETHALHGAAADPTAPLPSVADIPDAHQDVRSALGMLREAKVYAKRANDSVEWCCNRLLAGTNLLEHPGLPGVDGLLDAERDAAHGYLVEAQNLAGVSAAYAYTALCFVFPDLDPGF
jgi:hypothetical protein